MLQTQSRYSDVSKLLVSQRPPKMCRDTVGCHSYRFTLLVILIIIIAVVCEELWLAMKKSWKDTIVGALDLKSGLKKFKMGCIKWEDGN